MLVDECNLPCVLDKSRRLDIDVTEGDGDELTVLEERLEHVAFPWLASVSGRLGIFGDLQFASDIQNCLESITDPPSYEDFERVDELLARAQELMMNRASAYTRFDEDQDFIIHNELELARLLGIDGNYVQKKIENKMSQNDMNGTIYLPNVDTVEYKFMVSSGTLDLTGTGNTVLTDNVRHQLIDAGIVFSVHDANGRMTAEQKPTPDHPFVVRNLIIWDGITEIADNAFAFSYALRSVYFMGPVRSLDYLAFHCCTRCCEVGFAQPEKLESIESHCFNFDYELRSINVSPDTTEIGSYAFNAAGLCPIDEFYDKISAWEQK